MRWLFCIAMILGMSSPALAADYDLPILRGSNQPPAPVVTVGPATFTRWSGIYFGGVVSYNNSNADFVNATAPLIHFSLRSTTLEQQATPSGIAVLGKGSDNTVGGGAFFGYNTQWQDLILGVEATYNYTNLSVYAPASAVARIFPAVNDAVTLSATGRLSVSSYGEARFRAGYIVGDLLPYGFIGAAVAGASYSVTTSADVAQFTPGPNPYRRGSINMDALEVEGRRSYCRVVPVRARISRFSTVLDKTTRCYGATQWALDSTGR